jgi:hypothetical protein
MSSRKRKTSQMCAGCIVLAVDIELQLIMLKYWNEYKTDVKLIFLRPRKEQQENAAAQ